MSRIFRSDAVSVGERVVARREFGDVHSDVIGHVLSLDPLVIRPQEVGGYPSSLEAVEIPPEQLKIIKRLSPRTVRNSDIRAAEVAAAAASPGAEQEWTADGQWLMRASDGTTSQANSAIPLGHSAGFLPVPIDDIDAFFARHHLPTCLAIPERIGKSAEKLIDADPGAWEMGPEILVMVRALDQLPEPAGTAFTADAQPDPAWLDLYHSGSQPSEALAAPAEGTAVFARLLADTGETTAIARGTLTESGDGTVWLGLSALTVAADQQDTRLEAELAAHLLTWGKDHGAEKAWLEIEASDSTGVQLAEGLGFLEQHRHRYARRRGQVT